MAALITPFAIIAGGIGAIALVFYSFRRAITTRAEKFGARFAADLEVAGMTVSPQTFTFALVGAGAGLWVVLLLTLSPSPLIALPALAVCVALVVHVGGTFVKAKRAKRVAAFHDQLETVLRTISGGVRVGLGLRQALILVGEQCQDPARYEFLRVVGLTNVGVSMLDALDDLARRMTNPETAMLTRVIRVQAQTGGDLAGVLESLAATIRDRRRLRRRINAITAQGRATGWLLGLMPVGVGGFVFLTQPGLRDAMLHTIIGNIALAVALLLDGLAVFCLMKIVKIDP